MCRACGGEVENWEHLLTWCEGEEDEGEGMMDKVRRVLDGSGKAEVWMKIWLERTKKGGGVKVNLDV